MCFATQTAVIRSAPSLFLHLGQLSIRWWQSSLERPQWMRPGFCSPSLSSSPTLSPFWGWNQPIVMLSRAAEGCQPRWSAVLCSRLWFGALGVTLSRNPDLKGHSDKKRLCVANYLFVVCAVQPESFFVVSVVEDDEDDFPNTRTDGEFLHNNNGSKEKREYFTVVFKKSFSDYFIFFFWTQYKKLQ